MQIDFEKFEKIKKRAEDFYKDINFVNCPYFKEKILFNAKGLDHIKFKRWNNTRIVGDQYMRLKLIKYAPQVIEKSHTLQGYKQTKEFEQIKINSRWDKLWKNVDYYEFVAVFDGIRVRVIIKQISGGKKYFWSIVPFWKQDLKNGERLLHNGNPAED